MNDLFDLHIITHHHSEVYCGYFRRLVFGNSLTFSHIQLCFHAKPPNFPRLFDPVDNVVSVTNAKHRFWANHCVNNAVNMAKKISDVG